jgi:ornithine--oxo-acid transaminase
MAARYSKLHLIQPLVKKPIPHHLWRQYIGRPPVNYYGKTPLYYIPPPHRQQWHLRYLPQKRRMSSIKDRPPFPAAKLDIAADESYYTNNMNMFYANTYSRVNNMPVIASGDGATLIDIKGREYIDLSNGYGSCIQGHNHKYIRHSIADFLDGRHMALTGGKILNISTAQFGSTLITKLGLTSGHMKAIMCNGGAEANETMCKAIRAWGHTIKRIAPNNVLIAVATNNFCGRTITMTSASTSAEARAGYGPFTGGFITYPYNDVPALEKLLRDNKNIAGVMIEPIQGEAGCIVPASNYLCRVRELCTKYGVLMAADEIQTGIGRIGYMLACNKYGITPDCVTVGKSLGAGIYPVSAMIARADIADCIRPGTHGSTYGGNPLACAVGHAALHAIERYNILDLVRMRGAELITGLAILKTRYPRVICDVRGQGLMIALELHSQIGHHDFCRKLAAGGVITTLMGPNGNILRITPAYCITKGQIKKVMATLDNVLPTI